MFSLIQQPTVQYVANAPQSINIPAGGMLDELVFELKMAPTVTGANNTAANTLRGDELAVIKNLNIKGQNALPILDVAGDRLRWLSYLCDYGVPLQLGGAVGTAAATLGDGATANPTIDTVFIVPMWSTRAGKPFDSALDNTGEPNGLTLTVNWADHTAINASNTGFTANPTLAVYTTESGPNQHPFLRKRRVFSQLTFNATGAQRFNLEPGPAYRRFLIGAQNGSGVDTGAMFSDARLYIGGQLRQATTEGILSQAMRLRNGMRFAESITVNTKEKQAGNYLWEQCLDGYLSQSADTMRRQGNYIEFQITTAPCTITVVSEILEDLRRPEFGATQNVRNAA